MRCSRCGSSCLATACCNSDRDLVVRVAALALGVSRRPRPGFSRPSARACQRRFRDNVTIALEAHVATLHASIATIAHHERPEYLDRLSVLRNQVFVLDHMYMSLFSTCGWILRLGVTIALLVSIHPALALLALFSRSDGARPRRGVPASNARLMNAARRRAGWRGTSSPRPRRRRRARKSASPASASVWSSSGARPGSAGTRRRRRALGLGRLACAGVGNLRRRLRGRDRLCGVGPAARRPATCCWCWPRARGCRRMSAPPSGKSDSCAASGWTARAAWPGSRIMPRRSPRHADQPAPGRAR